MSKIKNLTVERLYKACKANRFILARDRFGLITGFNCMIADMAMIKNNPDPKQETGFISYMPCDFMTYINYKIPFLNFNK